MSRTIKLTTADGAAIDAYRADPAGRPKGGIVVLQEIFGVNAHIRRVADGFAAEGYLAIAPALFDRAKAGVELGYTPDDMPVGVARVGQGGHERTMLDVAAAVGYYGGNIAKSLDRRPKVPLMLHFGEHDDHIPLSDVAAIRAALPEVPVFTYDAGHGFNCDARGSYDKPSAAAALDRTLAFLAENLG